MKRFWKEVSVEAAQGGWTIALDNRPVKTPAREALVVPTGALANAIGGEWREVGDIVDPRAMAFTGLANAAIDRVAPDRPAFAKSLARYAEADLACYRAEGPSELVNRQAEHWDGLLDWARRRFDVDFATTTGLIHIEQPAATIDRLSHAIESLDSFHLAGLSPLINVGGSLIAALAVLEQAMTPQAAWDAVSIDDRWQIEQWGADAEAVAALANRECDFLAASRFLDLLN